MALTNGDVANKPPFAAVAEYVQESLEASALIDHNAHVDMSVLRRELPCPEVFDTLKLARPLLPKQDSYQLGMLVRTLDLAIGVPAGLTPHWAAYDALVTARLFVRLVTLTEGHPLTLEALRSSKPASKRDDETSSFF